MAATAQDASAPLRGPEKKDEDRDEDGKLRAMESLALLHAIQNVPAADLLSS